MVKQAFAYILLFSVLAACNDRRAIRIKGSDTEVNLIVKMAEAYHQKDADLVLSVSGGGSGLGIASLLNGNTDIANSSRDINAQERALFAKQHLNVRSFVFAQDAIAFVVSEKLGIDSIKVSTLSDVLSGRTRDWQVLGLSPQAINVYGRQSNSGTYEFVRHQMGITFSQHARQMNGNAQILEALKADPSGIGYVGAGYLGGDNGKGLKVLRIQAPTEAVAVSPLDEAAVIAGRYYFQRPLYQFIKESDSGLVRPILDFERGPIGAALIKQAGYYPPPTENTR